MEITQQQQIQKVRSNLYNNLVHYLQLGIQNLNSETLATYFQELNFNIIEYCEEKYPVQSKYSFDFESETKTNNKGKQRLKQYSRTTPNTPTLQKTTARHLQTPEQRTSVKLPLSITPFLISLSPRNPTQQQEPISTSANIINYLQENESNHSESLESEETESEPEEITKNKEKMATAYIAKIPEFTGEDNDTSPQKWLDKVQKAEDANAGLKDKLIKKVCSHAPTDLATAIRHAKSYEMAMEKANHTKLVNLAIGETSSAAEEKIDQLTKKDTENEIVGNYKETNKTGVINITLHHNNPITNLYHQSIIYQDHKIKTQLLSIQPYQTLPTQQYQIPARRLVQHNQFTPQNQLQSNHNKINSNNQLVPRNFTEPRPNHYHTQPSYLTMPEKQDFYYIASLEGRAAAQQQNPSYTPTTIPPARIAENTNLSDIFPFEFEANESPFLLSNAAVNKQKAITAMYTEATVKKKPIRLILDSRLAGSIITYQLMQQLKQNVDRPAQTVIVIANDIKKTLVGEIDDFPFSIDGITIPVKVFANANLNWETQELKISYQKQYTIVPATCGTFNKRLEKAPIFEFEEEKKMPLTKTYMALRATSNWAEETKQEIFEESKRWKKVRYSTPEPWKQPLYILLKCKDCNKKLSSMEAYISPEEEYETRTCYFCKACHREQFGSPKRSGKWDNTPCLTCGEMLPEECNWIDVAMREEVCNQTCQYALSISEKVRKRIPFDATYNSALNKLYHYPYDAEIIFDLAMALINRATQEDVCQMKEAEYIEYTMELAGFDYEDKVETYYQIASHTYLTKEA
ncbi:hypothetical protein G9A89_007327 [Geosiphon pyriformis]|nr:hypothetical protein G9A89_007327 [Geosiphon pyriformis]